MNKKKASETPRLYFNIMTINEALEKLKKSKFRSSFHLREYIDKKGLDTIKSHAYDFISKRLAPKCLMTIEPIWFEMANSPPYCVKKA